MCFIARLGQAIVDLCDLSVEIDILFKLLLDKITRCWNLWKSASHHYILFFLQLKIQIHLYLCMSYLHKCLCISIFISISLWWSMFTFLSIRWWPSRQEWTLQHGNAWIFSTPSLDTPPHWKECWTNRPKSPNSAWRMLVAALFSGKIRRNVHDFLWKKNTQRL